jgi:hypothetical protein
MFMNIFRGTISETEDEAVDEVALRKGCDSKVVLTLGWRACLFASKCFR